MPNLDFIRHLNLRYGKQSPIRQETKLFALNEAIDPDKLEKSINEAFDNMGPQYSAYFDMGLPADVALLFIDVCSFSSRFGDLDGDEIATFFDGYYDVVVPIIYKYGGEIDKVIGDGIICIFGAPFLKGDLNNVIKAANNCAKEIIKITRGTAHSSKIAFHCGTINYFRNKTGYYKELTMIGKPLTELFRLENVSIDERINYYSTTEIDELYTESIQKFQSSGAASSKAAWLHDIHDLPALKGVSYTNYCSIKCNL